MHPHQHPLFVNFIVYFNENQDYFECHEVLEEYWKTLPDGGKEHPLTAYILLATGMYHWRRGNPTGAIRTINKALKKFQQFNLQKPSYRREIDTNRLLQDVQYTADLLAKGLPFESFPIIVQSPELAALVEQANSTMDLLPLGSDAVIHKHMLRDRSDILRERYNSIAGRRKQDTEKKKGRF